MFRIPQFRRDPFFREAEPAPVLRHRSGMEAFYFPASVGDAHFQRTPFRESAEEARIESDRTVRSGGNDMHIADPGTRRFCAQPDIAVDAAAGNFLVFDVHPVDVAVRDLLQTFRLSCEQNDEVVCFTRTD